ncbi:MAG TPA: ABC transporter ATP-binding protein [Mycobacteriales bacterium]|nr:ABC transporter ATP-binding protein [Mycobacteriales bacterium]
MSAVVAHGLVKRYGALAAVDELSLVADPGAVCAILGPNGAGKTTTVALCTGFRRPDAGEVKVLGRAPDDRSLRALVGVMPQQPGSYPGARCAEMLRLVAAYYAHPVPPAALLSELGLDACAATPYRRLSGGQQQRLSLAMAIVGRPRVLFLDEPAAGLDVQARHAVWDLVRRLRSDGVAIVLTTHDMDEATQLADQVIVVDHGRVLAAGSVPALTRRGAEGTLRFRTTPGLDLNQLRLALPGEARVQEAPAGCYLVSGDISPQLLAAVTAWTASTGAMAQELRIEQRSLEDVFLELTGRGLRS